MYARITTVTGATDIDRGIAVLRDEALPQVQQQRGYLGMTVSADRPSGGVSVLTVWETKADLDASEGVADKVRGDTMAGLGGQATVERYEQVVWETGSVPPGPGSKLQIRRFRLDPDRIDANLAYFRSNVLPDITATPGFQAVRQLIDRDTGEGAVGTVWADDGALEAGDARTEAHRQNAGDRGVTFAEVLRREVLLSDVS